MLWSVVKCYEVLPSIMKCYEVLKHVMKCCEVLWSATEYYEVLWSEETAWPCSPNWSSLTVKSRALTDIFSQRHQWSKIEHEYWQELFRILICSSGAPILSNKKCEIYIMVLSHKYEIKVHSLWYSIKLPYPNPHLFHINIFAFARRIRVTKPIQNTRGS